METLIIFENSLVWKRISDDYILGNLSSLLKEKRKLIMKVIMWISNITLKSSIYLGDKAVIFDNVMPYFKEVHRKNAKNV